MKAKYKWFDFFRDAINFINEELNKEQLITISLGKVNSQLDKTVVIYWSES